MDSQKIAGFIIKARRRLQLQFMMKTLQIALSVGLALAFLVMVISRLFVFPYYEFYAYSVFALAMLSLLLGKIGKLPRRIHAIKELDHYMPHNQLLTLSQIPRENALVKDLTKQTEKEIGRSYELFKKDKKDWFSLKWIVASLGLVILLAISGLIPAPTQLAAKDFEQEKELVEDMIDKVEKQKLQTDSPIVKKELENLKEKLIKSATPELALREVVKKQKELAMKQQQKKKINTDQAKEEAKALDQASSSLAKQSGETQTALSEMGKPVAFDLQQSIAANNLTDDSKQNSDSESEDASETLENENGQSESAGEGQETSDSSSENPGNSEDNELESKDSIQADGDSKSTGQSEAGESETDSTVEGEGSSSAGGQSNSQGNGSGPSTGAGTGQGSKELLTIPSRIGGTGETNVDEGELAEGESKFEEGTVEAERGSIRPYQNVVGAYHDSYFSSADQLKLPSDLQKIVEQYFSAIEND